MPILYVMSGLPGSGKSTFIQSVIDADTYVYSTDDMIEAAAKAENKTYDEMFSSVITEVTKVSNIFLDVALADKKNVIWDQTNLTSKKRKMILSKFDKSYDKICVCFEPPVSIEDQVILENRLENRPGKTIPKHIMENMKKSYQEPTLNEGFNTILFYNIYGKATRMVEWEIVKKPSIITNEPKLILK